MTIHDRVLRLGLCSDFALPGATAHYPPSLEIEPQHLELELLLDLQRRSASGHVTHTVVANRNGADSLTLHAVDLRNVSATDADGREIDVQYDGKEMRVVWRVPFEHGEKRKLRVEYRVEEPVAGLYFSHPDSAYPKAPRWAVTDHETERARHWLPCVDLPSVRTTVAMRITAPAELTIIAGGALVREEKHAGGTKTAEWKLEKRCPSYLLCFAVGDFVRVDDGEHQGKPVAYFTTREFEPADLRRSFGRTRQMLEFLTKRLGSELPWPKYFQFAVQGIGGAMENISLVSWDDAFVLDETLAKEWSHFVDKVNVHEMAHTWFGDSIVCRDFSHAWLKESWAVYLETCWHEHTGGPDERDYDFYWNLSSYFSEADGSYMRPLVTRVFDHSWSMYDLHLYPGGAARLHMLRYELGDETFWAAVRDYVARYSGEVVETDDFRKVLERHSGRSLVKWFEQWIFSKGYPNLKVSFSYDAKKQEGTFEVEQTQTGDDIPVFEFATDLGWVIDGKLHTYELRVQTRKHVTTLPMAEDPEQVRFDVKNRTVCRFELNPGDERLRRQLVHAGDVPGRIHAAVALCKTGKRSNIEIVGAAYRREKFWGVRLRMAGALAETRSQVALDILAELLEFEKDGNVCEALVRAAGKFRDPKIAAALSTFVAKGPKLYRARGAAFEMLGHQGAESALATLSAASRKSGFGGLEQAGAFRGLANLHDPAAMEPLLAALPYGKVDTSCRPIAAAALGGLSRWLERPARTKAVQRVMDLLRDPQQRMQKGALSGLQAAEAGEAVPALEAWGAGLSAQDRTGVDRAAFGIRALQKPKEPAKDKELEEVRGKLRRLEERLDTLDAGKKAQAEREKPRRPSKAKSTKRRGKRR